MTRFEMAFALLAQQGRLEQLGRRFRPGAGRTGADNLMIWIIIALAIALAVWLLSQWFNAHEQSCFSSRRGLFRILCRAHGLDWSSRRLLARLARHQGLRDPGRLFLEPNRFDRETMSPALAAHYDEFKAICDTKLFHNRSLSHSATNSGDRPPPPANA